MAEGDILDRSDRSDKRAWLTPFTYTFVDRLALSRIISAPITDQWRKIIYCPVTPKYNSNYPTGSALLLCRSRHLVHLGTCAVAAYLWAYCSRHAGKEHGQVVSMKRA